MYASDGYGSIGAVPTFDVGDSPDDCAVLQCEGPAMERGIPRDMPASMAVLGRAFPATASTRPVGEATVSGP
jgi:hypothetical protein